MHSANCKPRALIRGHEQVALLYSMASSLSKREREMARSEGYAPLDLHESGDICYALKRHDAPENRHASGRSQDEIKKEVLGSPRMQQIILEVRIIIIYCRNLGS